MFNQARIERVANELGIDPLQAYYRERAKAELLRRGAHRDRPERWK